MNLAKRGIIGGLLSFFAKADPNARKSHGHTRVILESQKSNGNLVARTYSRPSRRHQGHRECARRVRQMERINTNRASRLAAHRYQVELEHGLSTRLASGVSRSLKTIYWGA